MYTVVCSERRSGSHKYYYHARYVIPLYINAALLLCFYYAKVTCGVFLYNNHLSEFPLGLLPLNNASAEPDFCCSD